MKLLSIIFSALIAGATVLKFENKTVTLGNVSMLGEWPPPEGLPNGWERGADVTRPGPFGAVRQVSPISRRNVYYPERLGENGIKHPIVFYKHGFTASSSDYRGTIDRMVSHGFVVVADDQGGVAPIGMANDVSATIIWFMEYTRAGAGLFTRDNVDISRIGMTGHSMGGGATVYITDWWGKADHPLASSEPELRFRGASPCQPWGTGSGVRKDTLAPILITGGLRDITVPPRMYRGTFDRSADLKAMVEFNDGHGAPNGAGAEYTPETTNFMYAALLGDTDRWYSYFPQN